MKLFTFILIIALISSIKAGTTFTADVTKEIETTTSGFKECDAFIMMCKTTTKLYNDGQNGSSDVTAASAVFTWSKKIDTTADAQLIENTDYYVIATASDTFFSQTIVILPGKVGVSTANALIKCSVQPKDASPANLGSAVVATQLDLGIITAKASAVTTCGSTLPLSKYQVLGGTTTTPTCSLMVHGGNPQSEKIYTIGGKTTADTVFVAGVATLDKITTESSIVILKKTDGSDYSVQKIATGTVTALCDIAPLNETANASFNTCQHLVYSYTEAKETSPAYATHTINETVLIDNTLKTKGTDYFIIDTTTTASDKISVNIFIPYSKFTTGKNVEVYLSVVQKDAQSAVIKNSDGVYKKITIAATPTDASCDSLNMNYINQGYSDDCIFSIVTSKTTLPANLKYIGTQTHTITAVPYVLADNTNKFDGIFYIQDGSTYYSSYKVFNSQTDTYDECLKTKVTYSSTTPPDGTNNFFLRCTESVTLDCNHSNLAGTDLAGFSYSWQSTNNNDDLDWSTKKTKQVTIPAATFYSNTNINISCTVDDGQTTNAFDQLEGNATIKYMKGDKPCTACTGGSGTGTGGSTSSSSSILGIVVLVFLGLIL